MDDLTQQMNWFFSDYEMTFNKALKGVPPDINVIVKSFTPCFIEASPSGVTCGKNDNQFKKVIPQGYSFYRSIGITSMEIRSKEITALDSYHTMVRVHWKSCFIRKDGSEGQIEFDVIYLLHLQNGEHRIFAYITGDEQKALKENGLV